jgi:hypothetical protein
MIIFFDTEFHDLVAKPKLISIGLIDETGTRTFYAELSDTYEIQDCSEWVRENVLPLLDGGEALMSRQQLRVRLRNWLESFGEPVTLAADSLAWDWPRIHELFPAPKDWPVNVAVRPLLLTMNYMNDYDKFEMAVDAAFADGLRRHHALDDAKANAIGYIAAGGVAEKPKPTERFTV